MTEKQGTVNRPARIKELETRNAELEKELAELKGRQSGDAEAQADAGDDQKAAPEGDQPEEPFRETRQEMFPPESNDGDR